MTSRWDLYKGAVIYEEDVEDVDDVEDVEKGYKYTIHLKASECGATGGPGPGGGGFRSGNDCAGGSGGSGGSSGASKRSAHETAGADDEHNVVISKARKTALKKYLEEKNVDVEAVLKETNQEIEFALHQYPDADDAKAVEALKSESWKDPNQLGALKDGQIQPKKGPDGELLWNEEQWEASNTLRANSYEQYEVDNERARVIYENTTIEQLENYLAAEGVFVNGHMPYGARQSSSGKKELPPWWDGKDLMTRMFDGYSVSGADVEKIVTQNFTKEEKVQYHKALSEVALAKGTYLKDVDIDTPVIIDRGGKKRTNGWCSYPRAHKYKKYDTSKGAWVEQGRTHYNSVVTIYPRSTPVAVNKAPESWEDRSPNSGYPERWTTNFGMASTVVHETGHARHYENLVREGFGDLETSPSKAFKKQNSRIRQTKKWKENVRYLSEYAGSDIMEFVAEAYTVKKMSPKQWNALPDSFHDFYYDVLKGP